MCKEALGSISPTIITTIRMMTSLAKRVLFYTIRKIMNSENRKISVAGRAIFGDSFFEERNGFLIGFLLFVLTPTVALVR